MIYFSFCRLGSFDGISYHRYPNYADRVKLITDGQGVDVILDPVLSSFFNCNLDCLGWDSRWVIFGAMGGIKVPEANLMKLLGKRASIMTSTLRNRTDSYKTELIRDMQRDTTPAFESGLIEPIIAE